ncbi:MAG: hypothetical protein QF879_00635 [Candidatus Latescibacteria bacterium]|nr:hypothetical protein [Candidatus Latescibacterota bacterium]
MKWQNDTDSVVNGSSDRNIRQMVVTSATPIWQVSRDRMRRTAVRLKPLDILPRIPIHTACR